MLKTVLQSLDGLDEALKGLYTEKDGAYVLQVEGVNDHPDVVNLKNAYERTKADRDAARVERDEAKAKAASLPADFDPEKWEKLKDGKPDEAALVKVRQTLEAELDTWKAKATAAEQRAMQNALDRDLTDALSSAGVTNALFAKAARQMLAPMVKIADDGKPVVETDMGPLSLGDHVKRWVASEGKDFVTPPSGGGSRGGSGAGTGKKWATMTSQEKVDLRRSDPQEYARVKDAG